MGASNSMIASGYGLEATATAYGAYASSEAIKAQGDYQKQTADINAEVMDAQASNAVSRGEREVSKLRLTGRAQVGAARASAAAQGLDVNSGSALATQLDAQEQTEKNIMTTRNNAWMEAWGYKTQATFTRSEGAIDQIASRGKAAGTLLTGGLSALADVTKGVGAYYKDAPPNKTGSDSSKPNYSDDPFTVRTVKERNDWFDRNRFNVDPGGTY